MLSKDSIFKLIASTVILLLVSVFAFADTVRLKDGSIIKGKIVSYAGGKFVVLIGQGDRQREMTFFADEIESIEFDNRGTPTLITAGSTQPGAAEPAEKKPSFIEKTDGNETIITVGSARRGNDRPTVDQQPAVDPDAVAVDPGEDTGGDPITDDTPVGGDPIADDTNDDPVDSSAPVTDPTKPAPVQINISVLADNTSNGWTNAGWVVKKGQKIRIISNGRISLGNGRSTGPKGIETLPDANKLIKDQATGCLIAVIGDDNNDFLYIGENREFTATRDGALFLGVNEGDLNDNSGAFDVIIEIEASGN